MAGELLGGPQGSFRLGDPGPGGFKFPVSQGLAAEELAPPGSPT
jgi:hypothetical protein